MNHAIQWGIQEAVSQSLPTHRMPMEEELSDRFSGHVCTVRA